MAFLTHIPQQPLAGFVELFWHCDEHATRHTKERVLPRGAVQLVISLRDEPLRAYGPRDADGFQSYRGPLVCGPRSEFCVIDGRSQASSMGVLFKPGGAFPFLGIPVGELHNLHLSLETLWGSEADELRDHLLEAKTASARFRILEESLLGQRLQAPAGHPAVALALKEFDLAPQDRTIAEVSERTGLSAKWFIQVFRDRVGLPPKLYCRIRRFQAALTGIGHDRQPDWARLALDCGYYDQAHFIRDFRAFSGLCPTSYLAGRGAHPNHVPLQG